MNHRIGVITSLRSNQSCFSELKDFGLQACQLVSWSPSLWTEELARNVREDARKNQVKITSFWAGWEGPGVWDFVEGPLTLGLVPAATRWPRVEAMKRAGQFARWLGVPAIITHLGFIPENAADPVFREVVAAVRHIAQRLKELEVEFWFETGQETPVALLRLIEAVGTGNLGINLDPANLILYGKANPIDALEVFGKYVRNVHAKDGMYPTDPMKLGHEVRVGDGKVRFPEFVRRLEAIGFKGEYIIEREISGDQQRKDIAATVKYLETLLT